MSRTRNGTTTLAKKTNEENHEQSEDDAKCGNCEELLSAKVGTDKDAKVNNTIECEICIRWFHTLCVDVSDQKYTMLVENNFHWYCPDCDVASKQLYKRVTSLQVENTKLKQDLSALTTKVTKVEASIDTKIAAANNKLDTDLRAQITTESSSLKNEFNKKINVQVAKIKEDLKAELLGELNQDDKLQNLKDELTADMNNKLAEIPEYRHEDQRAPEAEAENWQEVQNPRRRWENRQALQTEVNEALEEKIRIDKRKKNLIASELPEQNSREDEIAMLDDLIKNTLNIPEQYVITEVTRLGTRIENKKRLLRFTLQDLSSKKLILRKATTLRKIKEGENFYKVYIKPDLTPKQAQESKNLVAQLNQTRDDNPTKKFKIYRGKITEINANGEVVQ